MFVKIASSAVVAALVAPCIYMCVIEGHNQARRENEQAMMLRRADPTDFVRSWLKPYIASARNPDHKRAEVETLIRYGTTHVKPGVQLEDLKDALMIEFLAQVDGKPVAIDGFDDTLFIGTIGAAYNYNALKAAGITHVVSADCSARANFPEQIEYLDVNIPDKTTPDEIQDIFLTTSEYIEEVTSRKDFKVLVSDWEGAGWSAVLIMAHIMRSRRVGYESAMEAVMRTRPGIDIGEAYEFNLLQWERNLHLDIKETHATGVNEDDYGDALDDTDAFDLELDDDEVDGFDELGPEAYDDDGSHFLGTDEDYDEGEYYDDDDDDDVGYFVYYEDEDEDFIERGTEDISVSPKE